MFVKLKITLVLCVFFATCAAEYSVGEVDFDDLYDSGSEKDARETDCVECKSKENDRSLIHRLLQLRDDKHRNKYTEPDVFDVLRLLTLFASNKFLEDPSLSANENDGPNDPKKIEPKYHVDYVRNRKNVRNRRQVDNQNENHGLNNNNAPQNSNFNVGNQPDNPSNVPEVNSDVLNKPGNFNNYSENQPENPTDDPGTNSGVVSTNNQLQSSNDNGENQSDKPINNGGTDLVDANLSHSSNNDAENQANSQNNDGEFNSAVTKQTDSSNNNDKLETFTLKNSDSDSQAVNDNVAAENENTNDLNVRNAEVDNFQDGNVANNNDASVDGSAASSLSSTTQTLLETNFVNSNNSRIENNNNPSYPHKTDSNFANQESGFSIQNVNSVNNDRSNVPNAFGSLNNNGLEIIEVFNNNNDNSNFDHNESFVEADNDINENYPIPEWKSGVDTLKNEAHDSQNYGNGPSSTEVPLQHESFVFTGNPEISRGVSDFQADSPNETHRRAYNSRNDENDSTPNSSDSKNNQSKLTVPLSSNQFNNLQNVLKDNYGVNSKGSQPVANFQLNETANGSPVFVLVYKCSCDLGSQNSNADEVINENDNAEPVKTLNTRRMIPDDKSVPLENNENVLNSSSNVLVDNNNNNVKEISTTTNKPSNAFLENELLSKCRSLLAIQSEGDNKYPESNSFTNNSNNGDSNNLKEVNVSDILNNNVTQVDNSNSNQEAQKNVFNVKETHFNNNGNLENHPLSSNVQNQESFSQDNVQQRKRRDLNKRRLPQIRRQKRDLFSSLNDALKSAVQVPTDGIQTILDKVLNPNLEQFVPSDNDNRTKRQTKVDDLINYENDDDDKNSDSNLNNADKTVFDLQVREEDDIKTDIKNPNLNEYILVPNESTEITEASLKILDVESDENLSEIFSLIRPIQVNVYIDLLLNKHNKGTKKNKKREH